MNLFLVINILSLIFFAVFFPFLPPEIPLFYSLPTIEERLSPLIFIFLPLVLANLFVVFNRFFAKAFFPEDNKDFDKLLAYISYFYMLLSLYILVRTILLVV